MKCVTIIKKNKEENSMIRCPYCGNVLQDGSRFCNVCGAALVQQPVMQPAPQPVMQPVPQPVPPVQPVVQPPVQPAPVPPVQPMPQQMMQPASQSTNTTQETTEFVETTRRLLRWERKAWNIFGTVMTIFAIAYAALFFFIGFIFFCVGAAESAEFVPMGIMYFFYGIYFAALMLPLGIVSLACGKKIPQYLDSMDRDFYPTAKRCNNVGMLVLGYLFNSIALVFILINFIRMKANKRLVESITGRSV